MRKSVTPIIAIVLLSLMTVGAVGVAFFWVSNVQTTISEEAGRAVGSTPGGDCSRLNIVSVRGDKATVSNVGCDTVENVSVVVDGVLTEYVLDEPLSPGEAGTITFTESMSAGSEHCVTITLPTGQLVTECVSSSEASEEAGFSAECGVDGDCDDNNVCTSNICSDGLCTYPALSDGQRTGCTDSTGCSGTGDVVCACLSGDCSDSCGDGTCQDWETETSCSIDCEEGVCQEQEIDCTDVWFTGTITSSDYTVCPCCGDDGASDDFYNSTDYCCDGNFNTGDCFCGDGTCQDWEDSDSCSADCATPCGDGYCDYPTEDAWNCYDDCGGMFYLRPEGQPYYQYVAHMHLISGTRIIGNRSVIYDGSPDEVEDPLIASVTKDNTIFAVFSQNVTSTYENDLFSIKYENGEWGSASPVFTTPDSDEELLWSSNTATDSEKHYGYINCSCGTNFHDCCDIYMMTWTNTSGLSSPEKITNLHSSELDRWVSMRKSPDGVQKIIYWDNETQINYINGTGSSWSSIQTAVEGGNLGTSNGGGAFPPAIDDSGEIILPYVNHSNTPETYHFMHYNSSWYNYDFDFPPTSVASMSDGFMFSLINQSSGEFNSTIFVDGIFSEPVNIADNVVGMAGVSRDSFNQMSCYAALPSGFTSYFWDGSSWGLEGSLTLCGMFGCEEYERCSADCGEEIYCSDGVDNDNDGMYDGDDFECNPDINEQACTDTGGVWFTDAHYPANYSFTNDVNGEIPSGFTVFSDNANITEEVSSEVDGHLKVVNFSFTGDPSPAPEYIGNDTYTFSSGIFTMEWWQRAHDYQCPGEMAHASAGVTNETTMPPSKFYIAGFLCNGSLFRQTVSGGSSSINYFGTITNDSWYHFRIVLDLDNNLADVYVNDELKLEDDSFTDFTIRSFGMLVAEGGLGLGEIYYDALDGSWASDYTNGRNKLPLCCGDDTTTDTFSNSTHSCCSGSFQSGSC